MNVSPNTLRTEADRRLGNFLVKVGKLSAEQLKAASDVAGARKLSLVDAIEQGGFLSGDELAAAAASGLRLPLVNLLTVPVDDAATRLVDKETSARLGVVPLRVERDILVLGMANPFDQEAIREIEFKTGRRVRPAVAPKKQVLEVLEHSFRIAPAFGTILSQIPEVGAVQIEADSGPAQGDAEALSREAEAAPIVKMVNLIFAEALGARASDIHVEPGPNLVHVRYRINGILEDALQLPKWVHGPVVARIKVMSRLDITERRLPQDGRIKVRHRDRVADLRVSSLPTSDGEKIVMRVLDAGSQLRRLDGIGLSPRDLAVLRGAITKPEGMILVTGPTGSGKTTTLYAIIQEIFTPEINIVTIENPVEYEMKQVTQVEVNEKQGLTFAEALRSILRQDPDVILVGEIRDRETAEVAFHAAQTGHLVFSTLHTNDTTSTIVRLTDLGIEPYVIGASLLAVVSQRLVRTVCPSCGEPAALDAPTVQSLGLRNASGWRRGKGCGACRKSGYGARTGVYEVLSVTKRIQTMIEAKEPESAIRRAARQEGMATLGEDAVAKIEAGITTPDEVLRAVQVEDRGPRCPKCASPVEDKFTVCPYCLHQLQLTCGSCSMPLKAEWKSCPYCGTVPKAEAIAAVAPPVSPPAPAATEAPAPAAAPVSTAAAPKLEDMQVPRVLVVDDNEDLRKLVKLTLERGARPVSVTEAADGFEGLKAIEASPPHLVILDLMMPGMDGFEVCRRLRANLQTAFIPLIMLTARHDPESKELGFLAGTDDYVVKPFNGKELAARVARLLDRTYGLARPSPPVESPAPRG